MIGKTQIDPAQFFDTPIEDPVLKGVRRIDVKSTLPGDELLIGIATDTEPKDYDHLLRRLTRNPTPIIDKIIATIPTNAIHNPPWVLRKNPESRPDAKKLSARFHREIFLYEVRSFFLNNHLPLNQIRVFSIRLGKRARNLVIINTDFDEDFRKDVHDWRSRIQKRHGLHIRFICASDKLSATEKYIGSAARAGLLGDEQSLDDLITGLSVPRNIRTNKSQLEDHRRIPLLTIDAPRTEFREDAHLGVALSLGYYVDSHFQIDDIPNHGFKLAQDIVTIAVGYEISLNGVIGEYQIRQAAARNYLTLDFNQVRSGKFKERIAPPFNGSAEILYQAALAHQRANTKLDEKINRNVQTGEEVISELIIGAEKVFARECLAKNIPVLARYVDGSDRRILSNLKVDISDPRLDLDWPALLVGNHLLKLHKDKNIKEISRLLEMRNSYSSVFILSPDKVEEGEVRVRVKARGLEGQINQRQWLAHANNEPKIYTDDELERACHLINAKKSTEQRLLLNYINTKPTDLFSKIGTTVLARLHRSGDMYRVIVPSWKVVGQLAYPPATLGLEVHHRESIVREFIFLGLDLNHQALIFIPK